MLFFFFVTIKLFNFYKNNNNFEMGESNEADIEKHLDIDSDGDLSDNPSIISDHL